MQMFLADQEMDGRTDGSAEILSRNEPPYHVVLLDDDDHSYHYVVEMLGAIFGHDPQTAYLMAVTVDTFGRVVVYTGARRQAEAKRDAIHAYGPDPLLTWSTGPMAAVVEAAE